LRHAPAKGLAPSQFGYYCADACGNFFRLIRVDRPELEYVGFWMRFWAFIIDSVLACFLVWPFVRLFGGSDYYYYWHSWPWAWSDSAVAFSRFNPRLEFFDWVLPALAIMLFWIARQATPGKMAIGARIVDADSGAKPTTAQFIGRYLAYYVSLFAFGLGYLWIAFDARKQGWHDKLANTVVVRPRRAGPTVEFRRAPPAAGA
jgi:uncharacterized RDD family membrane protein YckC